MLGTTTVVLDFWPDYVGLIGPPTITVMTGSTTETFATGPDVLAAAFDGAVKVHISLATPPTLGETQAYLTYKGPTGSIFEPLPLWD
jgi:hypothetical protein